MIRNLKFTENSWLFIKYNSDIKYLQVTHVHHKLGLVAELCNQDRNWEQLKNYKPYQTLQYEHGTSLGTGHGVHHSHRIGNSITGLVTELPNWDRNQEPVTETKEQLKNHRQNQTAQYKHRTSFGTSMTLFINK